MRGCGGMSSGMRTTGDGRGASRIPMLATDRWFYSDHGGLDGWQALLAAGHAQGALPGPFLAATERLSDERGACVAFEAWRLRSSDEAQAVASSEEWNAAKTPAERVAVRRKKALAHENECATPWGVRFAEEAAAYEAGDAAAIAAAEDRSFQLHQECMAIDLEGRLHCQRQGAWPP